MADIRRFTKYDLELADEPEGEWVKYADHVAALLTQDRQHMEQQAVAIAEARDMAISDNLAYAEGFYNGEEQGQRDERKRIRKAVENIELWRFCNDHDCRVGRAVLAVIDGEESE